MDWDIADLPPGGGGEIRIQAEVPLSALPGAITNQVQITAAEPDLQVGKIVDLPSTVSPGTDLT